MSITLGTGALLYVFMHQLRTAGIPPEQEAKENKGSRILPAISSPATS